MEILLPTIPRLNFKPSWQILKIYTLKSKLKNLTGDFNAHSQLWWPDGDTTPEGTELEELFTSIGLFQLISEPTNFEPHKNPSCIDLIITDQPNLILDCGTRPSLDPYCHHQMIYGKINFRIPPPRLLKEEFGISIEQTQLLLKEA